MKKTIVFLFALVLTLTACTAQNQPAEESKIIFSDEMKIAYGFDLSEEDGSDSAERLGDHADTPYFTQLDFYNMESSDTLTILSQFKTIQQSSEWSCGPATALMVIQYLNPENTLDEAEVAALRPQGVEPGATSLSEMIAIFETLGGYTLESAQDYSVEELANDFWLDTIQDYLAQGLPVMIGWNDWGGHWQAIIGYDTMGTETVQDDVIIVADPYDTTDHNQDGYGVYPAERFIYNFTFYNFFEEAEGENNNFMQFLVAKPQ